MDHVAILRKARVKNGDNLLGDIIDGKKTIESRWYVNKIAPWNNVTHNDTIYFKESGCPVSAKARVTKVIQYENLTKRDFHAIIRTYGNDIAPNTSIKNWKRWIKTQARKRYCILVFLDSVEELTPFNINKSGYGISSAWLVTNGINQLKV